MKKREIYDRIGVAALRRTVSAAGKIKNCRDHGRNGEKMERFKEVLMRCPLFEGIGEEELMRMLHCRQGMGTLC